MPRLLHHHNRLLARPNRRHLWRLLDRAVPADGWKSAIDRGLLIQAEVDDNHRRQNVDGRTLWFLLMMMDVVVAVDEMMD